MRIVSLIPTVCRVDFFRFRCAHIVNYYFYRCLFFYLPAFVSVLPRKSSVEMPQPLNFEAEANCGVISSLRFTLFAERRVGEGLLNECVLWEFKAMKDCSRGRCYPKKNEKRSALMHCKLHFQGKRCQKIKKIKKKKNLLAHGRDV